MMNRQLGLIALLFVSLSGWAQGTKNFLDQPYIEVSGTAELEIVPDEIYLDILLDAELIKPKRTLDQLEKDLRKALEKVGIPVAEDLKVRDQVSRLRSSMLGSSIESRKAYRLMVHDAATVTAVYEALARQGIANISIARVSHSKIEEYRQEVKVAAIKAGKEKAERLTAAVGQKVGEVLHIKEDAYTGYQGYAQSNVMLQMNSYPDALQEAPDIEFEKIKLESTILIKFAIE